MQEVFKRNKVDKELIANKLLTSKIIMIDEIKTIQTVNTFKCLTCDYTWQGRLANVRNYVSCPKCREKEYNTSPLYSVPKEDRGYVKVKINLIRAIIYKGGKCQACNIDILNQPWLYEFHHTDPLQKDKEINTLVYSNWETIKSELDKCVLLCSHCHRNIHFDKTRYEEYKDIIFKHANG